MNDKQMMLTKHLAKINLKPEDVLITNDTLIAVEGAMEDYKNAQLILFTEWLYADESRLEKSTHADVLVSEYRNS